VIDLYFIGCEFSKRHVWRVEIINRWFQTSKISEYGLQNIFCSLFSLLKPDIQLTMLQQYAREVPGLPKDQDHSVSHFLQRVRKEIEKTIRSQRGTLGNFMKPGVMATRIPVETSHGTSDRNYFFCSMPYHKLALYMPLGATASSRLHPARTLLQSKYASTTKKRDFEQAVCFLNGTPPNYFFQTSNLWFLILNDSQ
jgi:hypothetical protein